MLRAGLLYLSEQKQVFRFIRANGIARKLASRFVAGETLDAAVAAVRDLNARNITATLDLLGESVTKPEEARAAALTVVEMFDRLERDLHPVYGDGVGVVIQSYLFRSAADVERLNGRRARVRLCKGAYQEPPSVAFPAKRDVDRSYAQLMEQLLEHGNYPALATHDEALIERARRFVLARALAPASFEFQMLYGVRRDLQDELVKAGFNVRVYVPFGTQWYPYLMRRLAERPANIAFILGNVVREGVR